MGNSGKMHVIKNKFFKTTEKVIFLAILSFFILGCIVIIVKAKRSSPNEVEPVIYSGIKYTAPHEKMGYVETFNNITGEKLQEIKVYDVKIDPNMEADVQGIFITNLSVVNGKLIIINEAGIKYEIDIEGHDAVSRPPSGRGKVMGLDTPYFVGFMLPLIAMIGVVITLFVKWRKAK